MADDDPQLESVRGAFEAALVALMNYYNHFRREQAAEIERLKAENERLRAELDAAQLRSIEARNPGIDMDTVRAERAQSGQTS